MSCQMLQLVLHFFLGDINIFCRGNAVNNELSLHVVLGTLFVALT